MRRFWSKNVVFSFHFISHITQARARPPPHARVWLVRGPGLFLQQQRKVPPHTKEKEALSRHALGGVHDAAEGMGVLGPQVVRKGHEGRDGARTGEDDADDHHEREDRPLPRFDGVALLAA